MTWAVQRTATPRPAMGADVAPPSNWQGLGASAVLTFQNTYGTVERQAKIVGEQDTMAAEAVKRLGPDGMKPIIDDFNSRATSMGLTERIIPEGATTDEILGRLGSNGSKAILDAARLAAETNPSAWADLDLSQDGIDAKVTERMAAERRVNEELLALSPNPGWNNLIGGIAGTVLDPINIAAAVVTGGGGSLWRVMMREAIAGAGVEMAEQPLRVKTAEELSLPAPNLLENMALGAAGGAIFGGILEGVPRAIRAVAYARRLRDTTTLPGIDPVASESAVRAAETAIDRDMNPLDAVAAVLRDSPVPVRRDPLILTPEMSVTASTPKPTALAPDPITTESLPPLPGDAPTTPGETAAMAERALSKAVKRGPKPEKQIDLSTFVVRAGGIWKGDDTGEIAAMQYKRPGFTKRDLFARTTAGDNGGGLKLDMMRERATEAGYLPQGSTVADFLNALRDDVTGTGKRYPNGDAPQKRSNFSPDYTPDYSPQDAYLAQDKSIDGFWVDPNLVGLMTPEQAGKEVAEQLDEYLARKGITLTPRERFDISNELEMRGGDGAYLVERAMERWTDEHEALLVDRQRRTPNVRDEWIPFGDEGDVAGPADQAGRPGDGKQPPDASGASGRGADAPELPAYEATPIGDQAVIPGTRNGDVGKQAALRAKAEAELKALQSKQRRLNQVRVEDEVDGLFARKTLDMFDDITSPEAQKAMDVEMRDIRQMAEEGGIEAAAVADDGRALNSLQDIVDEIDDMDTLAREFDLCRRGGTEE